MWRKEKKKINFDQEPLRTTNNRSCRRVQRFYTPLNFKLCGVKKKLISYLVHQIILDIFSTPHPSSIHQKKTDSPYIDPIYSDDVKFHSLTLHISKIPYYPLSGHSELARQQPKTWSQYGPCREIPWLALDFTLPWEVPPQRKTLLIIVVDGIEKSWG